MRFPSRARVVVVTIVPCYVMIAVLFGFFAVRYKERLEKDAIDKGMLIGDRLAVQIATVPESEIPSILEAVRNGSPWLSYLTVIDIYGQVVAADDSGKGLQWFIDLDGDTRVQIPKITAPFVPSEAFEIYRPVAVAGRKHILQVGLDSGPVRRGLIGMLVWFLPGLSVALLIALFAALLLSRLSQKGSITAIANMVTRVADGHNHDRFELARMEPAFSALKDSLDRLFVAFAENRERLGMMQRTIEQVETQAAREKYSLTHNLSDKESTLQALREEVLLLRERGKWAILQLGEGGEILESNYSARSWLTLGPTPTPRDLPAELIGMAIEVLKSTSGESKYGKITVRHPLVGRERQLSVSCIRLSVGEEWVAKRVLVILEDLEGKKDEELIFGPPIVKYLDMLRDEIISFGRDLHTRAGKVNNLDSEALLEGLGCIVRDLDAVCAAERARSQPQKSVIKTKSLLSPRQIMAKAEEMSGIRIVLEATAPGKDGLDEAEVPFRLGREDLEVLVTFGLEAVVSGSSRNLVRVRREKHDDRMVIALYPVRREKGPISGSGGHYSRKRMRFLPLRLEILRLLTTRLNCGMKWNDESSSLTIEIPCFKEAQADAGEGKEEFAVSFFSDQNT